MIQRRFPTITEDSIATLVDTFYARLRRHPALEPVFNAAIAKEEWPEHLATMQRFWASVLLASDQYSGNPFAAHRAVAGIERPLFTDWLFSETASELFDPAPASVFATKAQRISTSLQLVLFYRLGDPPEGLTRKPAA